MLAAFLARTCPAAPIELPPSAIPSVKKFCHLAAVPPRLNDASTVGIIAPPLFN